MKNKKPITINSIKYLAVSFFVLIALINLADSLAHNRQTGVFDLTFLALTCLPLLINKRLFILCYGIIASFISLPILILFSISSNTDALLSYLFGLGVFVLALLSSLALVYVGTHSEEKGRFKLI